jgi:hypothetical protein
MLKETIIAKFTQVLAAIPQAQQDALAVELAKMIPATPDADVDWRIGSGYDQEEKLIRINFSAKITPIKIEQDIDLFSAITQLIDYTPAEQFASIYQILELITEGLEKPYALTLGMMPVLPLSDTMSVLTFRIKGIPNALLYKKIQEEEAILN